MGCNLSKSKTPSKRSSYDDPIGGPSTELENEEFPELPRVHAGAILGVECLPNSQLLTCGDDKKIVMYDVKSLAAVKTFTGHTKAVSRVKYASKTRKIYSCSRDTTIMQWSLTAEPSRPSQTFEGHEFTVAAIAVNSDENILASGSRDTAVVVWDTETGAKLNKAKISRNLVTCLQWFHGESTFAQGSEDLSIRLWDFRQNMISPAISFNHGAYFALGMDLSSNGDYIVTSSKGGNAMAGDTTAVGGEIMLWDRRKQQLVRKFPGHTHDATSCRFYSTGNRAEPEYIISASKDQTVRIWDVKEGQCSSEFTEIDCGMFTDLSRWDNDQSGTLRCAASTFLGALFSLEASPSNSFEDFTCKATIPSQPL